METLSSILTGAMIGICIGGTVIVIILFLALWIEGKEKHD